MVEHRCYEESRSKHELLIHGSNTRVHGEVKEDSSEYRTSSKRGFYMLGVVVREESVTIQESLLGACDSSIPKHPRFLRSSPLHIHEE